MSKKNFKISDFGARTLTWWRARRTKLDMDPPYQRRGRLWSATDKAYLIDSILNGYDVPKFYVADFTWGDSSLNKNNLPYAIIDGKQRFEAIFDFFDGKIVLNRDFVFLESPELKLGGLAYKDLQLNYGEIAETFDQYNLSIMSVVANSEVPINELFVRLNRSKALTGAEVRNAMSGKAPGVIREIARHDFFQTNIRFSVSRGQDLNAAAKILMFEYHNEIRETKKRNLDEFINTARQGKAGELELAGRRVMDTLDVMSSIFLPKDEILSSAGVFPIYYLLIVNVPGNTYSFVREYLVRFEEERRENRKLRDRDSQSKKIDQMLLKYDLFNRSTNDQKSHEGRFEILIDRFLSPKRKRPSRKNK